MLASKMNTKLHEQMDLAWQAYQEQRPEVAFERLHCAVWCLIKAFEEAERGNARTANIASCLANGIQPD